MGVPAGRVAPWRMRRTAMPIRVFDPTLRAGWEPNTPIADSLLRRFLVN
jgi:hypothetical protein